MHCECFQKVTACCEAPIADVSVTLGSDDSIAGSTDAGGSCELHHAKFEAAVVHFESKGSKMR